MDRQPPLRHPPSASAYPSPFPPLMNQPPAQMPFSDPFSHHRDPFLPATHGRRDSTSLNNPSRSAWPQTARPPPSQASNVLSPSQSNTLPPHSSTASEGVTYNNMSLPYDPSRRRSLGAAASPPQYAAAAPFEPPTAPSPFGARNMPPPSPPQGQQSTSTQSMMGSAPRGPPISSPFSGIRDLASLSSSTSSHRPGTGMSISSILGASDDRKPSNVPTHQSSAGYSSSMHPPSPARARASSMREASSRPLRETSPGRVGGLLSEQRPASVVVGYDRSAEQQRRDRSFASPQLPRESAHSFRAFQPSSPDTRPIVNGNGMGDRIGNGARPNSQPVESAPIRPLEDGPRRDEVPGARLGMFRAFGDTPHTPRSDGRQRQEPGYYHNVLGPTSQPVDRQPYSPRMGQDPRDQRHLQPAFSSIAAPMREDQSGLFRSAYAPQPASEHAQESIETRPMQDIDRFRNGNYERPLTFDEHRRMEHQQPGRKDDGSTHRSLLGISPELNRRGRNSPLPQAVQGAQLRHIGPGGDNPGIKSEFGRMFSGLGSGVGSATPSALNGASTPSRMMSPSTRHVVEGGDLVRTAVAEIEENRGSVKPAKGSKKAGRRSRDEVDRTEQETYDGRMTPSLSQRGSKRAKTNHAVVHHHHHHPHHHHPTHHHHYEPVVAEPQSGSFSMLRFPSNPPTQPQTVPTPATHHHHHHHHHTAHAHPGHHHHHPPARAMSVPKNPTITIDNKRLLEAIASKPRKHLGSQLYSTEVYLPPAKSPLDHRHPFVSDSKPIPYFQDKENCTFTVRVPRWYLSRTPAEVEAGQPSRLEEICRRRQVFGAEVYTDDSDVVAAAVHSGWIKGDYGEWSDDVRELCPPDEDDDENDPNIDNDPNDENNDKANNDNDNTTSKKARQQRRHQQRQIEESPLDLPTKPLRPVLPPSGYDMHVTLLILPPLEAYASVSQHHLLSREWAVSPGGEASAPHDGMSFLVHAIKFVDEGVAGRNVERSAEARKSRLRREEEKRREAVEGLLGLKGGGVGDLRIVKVGA